MGLDVHPVDDCVKIKVAVPLAIPVTRPLLFTIATEGLELAHIPPVEGDNVEVLPIQILDEPVIETVGLGVAVILAEATAEQPLRLVTVTLYNVEGTAGNTVTD